MKAHVLKVRGKDNLTQKEQGIAAGHTVDGWQMPKTALPGGFGHLVRRKPR